MKKILCVLLTVLLLTLPLAGCADSTNQASAPDWEQLVGVWKAADDGDQAGAEIRFEKSGEKCIGEYRLYDASSAQWINNAFELISIENYTITLQLSDGTTEQRSFAASKDTVYLSGTALVNAEKNIENTYAHSYVLDGVVTPIIGDVFLGMTKAEFENSLFGKSCTLDGNYFRLPQDYYDWYPAEYTDECWGALTIPGDRLEALHLTFAYEAEQSCGDTILNGLLEDYSAQFGAYEYSDDTYTWKSGNLTIAMNVRKSEAVMATFEIFYVVK